MISRKNWPFKFPAASYEAEFDNALDEKAGDSEEEPQPLLRMKNIRKDVFHYLKAVLEESRIFLPMKLPEDTFSPPPIQEQQVQVIFPCNYYYIFIEIILK